MKFVYFIRHWPIISGLMLGIAFSVDQINAQEITHTQARSQLESRTIDLPERFKLNTDNGMVVKVRDHADGVDLLFMFHGLKHASGATQVSRILFQFKRGKEILNIIDSKQVYFHSANSSEKFVDCMSGYFVIDRKNQKIQVDCIVFDDGDWKRFGWNGVWDLKVDPGMNTKEILENMGVK